MAGVCSSLLVIVWIATGATVYGPQVSKPPVNRDGCPSLLNSTGLTGLTILGNITDVPTHLSSLVSNNADIPWIYRISYLWYIPLSMIVTTAVGVIVSYLTGGNEDVDSRLLSPLFLKSRSFWRGISCPGTSGKIYRTEEPRQYVVSEEQRCLKKNENKFKTVAPSFFNDDQV